MNEALISTWGDMVAFLIIFGVAFLCGYVTGKHSPRAKGVRRV